MALAARRRRAPAAPLVSLTYAEISEYDSSEKALRAHSHRPSAMPREPNHASAVGNPATKLTKATRIICLGHLATHIDAKVALMKARGFTLAEPMYAQVESLAEQKAKLKAAGPALLLVGGAMMHTHGEAMKELFAFIPEHCPDLAVDIVQMSDFAAACPGRTPPFTPEDVAAASIYAIEQLAVAE
jgi:hypothetical protein